MKELLYIGQSDNLYKRISNHDKKDLFDQQCQQGEVLCYSVAEVPSADLDIVENALIFAQQPRLNTEHKDKFIHDVPVSFQLEGRCRLMKYQNFTVK